MKKVYLVIGASSDIGMEFIRKTIKADENALFYAHYRTMNETLADIKKNFDGQI